MDKLDRENRDGLTTVEQSKGKRVMCTMEKPNYGTLMHINGNRYVFSSIQKAGKGHDLSRHSCTMHNVFLLFFLIKRHSPPIVEKGMPPYRNNSWIFFFTQTNLDNVL